MLPHSPQFSFFPRHMTVLTCLVLAPITYGCRSSESGDNGSEASDGTNSSNSATASTDDSTADDNVIRPDGWMSDSHSNDVAPNYDAVFSEGTLMRFDITFDADMWNEMQSDLDANMSMGGPPGNNDTADYTPMWGEATLEYNGQTWEHVGVRYKGNSSLNFAYRDGTDKFPMKLDFDEWEDEYPSIDDQRFYGFKQLNLASNYDDNTMMREKVAADLFREFGVPAAHVSFCEVYIDKGAGSQFVGVYSLIEEVDDTLAETQFPDTEGNLYKPDGDAASFANGSFDEAEMDLKSNEDTGDFSDVRALYDALHSANRTTDEVEFKNALEAVFDVDLFLRYLAVNQVIQNWDTYGVMTHNYFLYNDRGLLRWIPWDNNEAFGDGKMGGALSLALSEVGDDWPLLRYVLDVAEYEETYRTYVGEFTEEFFTTEKMAAIYDAHALVLEEAAQQETNDFSTAVQALKSYTATRVDTASSFLN